MISQALRVRRALRFALALSALAFACAYPATAQAEARLVFSDPSANAVRAVSPLELRLLFDEPLDPGLSWARLYSADGTLLPLPSSYVGDEPLQLTLPLPDPLANGVYTVQWYAVSALDDTPTYGFYPFRIGSDEQDTPVGPPHPDSLPQHGWLSVLGRSLTLLGILAACGAVLGWHWILHDALRGMRDEARQRAAGRVTLLAVVAIGLALTGSVLALLGETERVRGMISLDNLRWVLTTTRFGLLWALGVVLLLLLGAVLRRAGAIRETGSLSAALLASGLVGLTLVPFTLAGHAAMLTRGREAAVASSWLHLAATTIWIGGLLALLVGLLAAGRHADREEQQRAYEVAIQRFSTLALSAITILFVTGLYAGWLHAGSLEAVTQTRYGTAMQLKAATFIALLALTAAHLLWITPRLRRRRLAARPLRAAAASELVVAVVFVVAVAWMSALPTARNALLDAVERYSTAYLSQDVRATLFVSPGAVGLNQYTVDLGAADENQLEDASVLLRATPANPLQGTREIPLQQVDLDDDSARYEASGRDLSIAGRWSLELIIRRTGMQEIHTSDEITVSEERPEVNVPGAPPLFVGALAPFSVLLAGCATVGAITGMRWTGDPQRGRQIAVSSAGLLAFAVLGLAFALTF